MTETSNQPTKQDNEKMMGILSYIGPLALIPYFSEKDSKFVRYHARQGLALAIVEVAVWVLYYMLVFPTFFIGLGGLLALGLNLISLLCLALSVMGIVNVSNHKEAALPVVSKIADALKL